MRRLVDVLGSIQVRRKLLSTIFCNTRSWLLHLSSAVQRMHDIRKEIEFSGIISYIFPYIVGVSR